MEPRHEDRIIPECAGSAEKGTVTSHGQDKIPFSHGFIGFIGILCKTHIHQAFFMERGRL